MGEPRWLCERHVKPDMTCTVGRVEGQKVRCSEPGCEVTEGVAAWVAAEAKPRDVVLNPSEDTPLQQLWNELERQSDLIHELVGRVEQAVEWAKVVRTRLDLQANRVLDVQERLGCLEVVLDMKRVRRKKG